MANALSLLLEAGSAAGTVRDDVTGSTLLRALGGICRMRPAEGWLVEARQIAALLFDGLRHGATQVTWAGGRVSWPAGRGPRVIRRHDRVERPAHASGTTRRVASRAANVIHHELLVYQTNPMRKAPADGGLRRSSKGISDARKYPTQ